MSDNDIIKALECCVGKSLKRYLCMKCPLRDRDCYGGALLMPAVLELINRQKAEIEESRGIVYTCRTDALKSIRTEAVKEFAERLKDAVDKPREIDGEDIDFIIDIIDSLVKEMTGCEDA